MIYLRVSRPTWIEGTSTVKPIKAIMYMRQFDSIQFNFAKDTSELNAGCIILQFNQVGIYKDSGKG